MAKLSPEAKGEIERWDAECQTMEQEARMRHTYSGELRAMELRNIRTTLIGLLEATDLFTPEDVEEMVKSHRKRIEALKSDPESMGIHSSCIGLDVHKKR
jgi:hypothetical protein